ncbi:MAG: methyltransferase domain-containing protein [Bacteroidales bacterium]|jgi:ubiquinone/menaquinone biosynthesis C-methylase UbiE|nr:methyltransferase domain-containing protein [Bacteroidales bacterium]
MNTNYTAQDRGDKQSYQQYLEAMDAVSIEKVASASAFFEPGKNHTIVDVGMASGTSSAILAKLFPEMQIIGVDINPQMVAIAQKNHQFPNLSFQVEDGEKLSGFERESVNGFFNCSAIHHITSFNNYDNNHALNTLQRQAELLKNRGVLIVRDFVKPEEKEVILELSAIDKPNRPNDCDLLGQFAQTARSLASLGERGFPIKELKTVNSSRRCFRLFYTDAVEFIRRKDYYSHWEVELQEEYGYFTQREFEAAFHNLGLRIILSAPIYNQWIINHRYRGQFRLFDLDGSEIGFPPTNYLIAGEKTNAGKQINLVRRLPKAAQPFLRYLSYRNQETNQILDVVERPNDVKDIIPYYREENKITLFAKHAYPRPLSNTVTDSPVLDNKCFSGYITEGITVAQMADLQKVLSERFAIQHNQYTLPEQALHYYTSPGGINEKVSSVFIPLNVAPNHSDMLKNGFSGFKESGFIHSYDAAQLLTTAQTGALVEARLELNIYYLFSKLNIPLPKWLGEKIEMKEVALNPLSLDKLLEDKKQIYIPSENGARFLRTERAYFAETGIEDSHAVLEFVYPQEFSSNTLITLPVCKYHNEIHLGLEIRDLPVPQLYSGNSSIVTIPAKRLPKKVTSLFQLNTCISQMRIADASVETHFKLGEKYFPSIGITTEQVYPYIVCLDKATDHLAWVSLTDLLNNLTRLEDAHLLICLMRLKHAIKY